MVRMIRAYIREDLPSDCLNIAIIQNPEDGPRRILVLEDSPRSFGYRWEALDDNPGEPAKPTMRLTDSAARALLETLARHYGGAEDARALRRDYDAERARVDTLTAALVDVTRRLTTPPPEAVTYSTSFPGGLPEEDVASALKRTKRDGQL